MRRWIVVAALVALAVAVGWGEGGKEASQPLAIDTITLTIAGGKHPSFDEAIAAFVANHANMRTRWLQLTFADGSTMAQDAMIAAGIYPNLLVEFAGRLSKLAVKASTPGGWEALDLRPYLGDEWLQFYSAKEYTQNDGTVRMIPQTMPAQGMLLNLDLLDRVGYALPGPDKWTLIEFVKMAEAVKRLPDHYATILFAKNASGDYLWMQWFATFGYGTLYDAAYTKTALDGALPVFQWLDDMVAKGYAPPESAELWDDAALELFQKGIIAATPMRPEWVAGYMKGAVDNGWIEKPFRVVMYPFPTATGKTPATVGAGNGIVVNDTGIKVVNDAAATLATKYLVSKEWVTRSVQVYKSGFPVRRDAGGPQPKPEEAQWFVATRAVIDGAGYLDVGYTLSVYPDIRASLFPLLQAMWTDTLTPAQALAEYRRTVDGFLAKK